MTEIGAAVARAFTLFLRGDRGRCTSRCRWTCLWRPRPPGRCGSPRPPRRPCRTPRPVRRAARALREARRPAPALGGGARGAATVVSLAEACGAPVVTTANGKGVVPERHPLSLGVSLHTESVQKWLAGRDVVLAVGTELAESDFWSPPTALGGTLVRADLDPDQMHSGPPTDIALVGDARASLEGLLSEMGLHTRVRHDIPDPRGGIDVDEVAVVRDARFSGSAARDARWLPYLRAIRAVLADDAVITSDSAQCCYYGALRTSRWARQDAIFTRPASARSATRCPCRAKVACPSARWWR